MMTGKEKLYFLLDAIDDARAVSPSGQPILIHPYKNLVSRYTDVELIQLFTKLEVDEKVLKVLNAPTSRPNSNLGDPYANPEDEYYHLEILPAFDNYFLKIQEEEEYQEFTGKKPPIQQVQDKARPKYDRKALEKIWNVLQDIEGKRQLVAEGEEIQIQKYPYGSNIG